MDDESFGSTNCSLMTNLILTHRTKQKKQLDCLLLRYSAWGVYYPFPFGSVE